MRGGDELAAGGECRGERLQDEPPRLERAADIGHRDRSRRVGEIAEQRAHKCGDHIGFLAGGAAEYAEGTGVSSFCSAAYQLGQRGDARAVGDVRLREGDDVEVIGKGELLAHEVNSSHPIQPPLPSSPIS